MTRLEHASLLDPANQRPLSRGVGAAAQIGGLAIGRAILEPGWRWSESVKPLAGTEWCEAPHFQYHAAGRIRIIMSDGAEFEVGPGEVTSLPSGHDAYVVGDDPVILVDFYGAGHYAEGGSTG